MNGLGSYARAHPWWTPIRLLLALAGVVFALAMVAKAPCAAGAWWDSPRDYANACHSGLATGYADSGLAERIPAWDADPEQHTIREEQGVPDAALSYVSAVAAQSLTGWPDVDARAATPVTDLAADDEIRHEAVVFMGVAAAIQLVTFLTGVLLLARSVPHPGAMVVVAGAPVIVFTALIGWDMILFALVCAVWWAWQRGHAMLAGALVGVCGVLAFWPLLVLPALALASIRRGNAEAAGRAFGAAVVAWVCCAVPLVALAGGAFYQPVGAYVDEALGTGALWEVLGALGANPDSRTVNIAVGAAMVVVLIAVWVFAATAFRAPDAVTVAFLLVTGWFWITKTYEPQYALALLPLAALAWPRWRDLLVWQSAEILFVLGTWWHLGGFTTDGGDTDRVYPVLILVRVAGQAWLVARVVLDHRQPAYARTLSPAAPGRTS